MAGDNADIDDAVAVLTIIVLLAVELRKRHHFSHMLASFWLDQNRAVF